LYVFIGLLISPFLFAYTLLGDSIIRKLKTPVFIIQGDADLQVKVWDAERLHVCNMNSQMDIIDDMNHVLKVLSSQDDMNENIASYSNPKISVSARMMAIITEFINRNN